MSQTLTVRVSDEAYDAIRKYAEAAGTSPAEVAAISLEQEFAPPGDVGAQPTERERQLARERFERHFGAVNLGYATGVDNESIDRDLAREYADSH